MASNISKYSPRAIINAPPEQRRTLLSRFWFPAVILLALAAGGLTGIIAAYELNYSPAATEVAALATYRPSVVTRVYADDGETGHWRVCTGEKESHSSTTRSRHYSKTRFWL
jgi:hypothetical protein